MNCGENNDNETECVVKFYIALQNNSSPDQPGQIGYEVLIDSVVWCDDKVSVTMVTCNHGNV